MGNTGELDAIMSLCLAQVTFSLSFASRFGIDKVTGRIYTTSAQPTTDLDRELTDTFYLSVDAIDGGGLSASSKIIIKLNDLNDNAPKFVLNSFSGSIEENSVKWLENVHLMAIDLDVGLNAMIKYGIIGGDFHHLFDIDNNRITLKNNKTLDFEELYRFVNKSNLISNDEILLNLVVEAKDSGDKPLTDQEVINVIVKVSY
jgi:hypothetical protein